ncbi:MAG: UDP-N-acetylmuramate dehydrogenase [Bacteroidales bacterium]|jgi:UDP-N-acetylmuramate dehydrogenase|nr:UDP-N-acetylmuramate dehydrogenase [Bacteroidales bacterium]
MHLDQKISLKPFHTFGMEVEARYFIEPRTKEEILTLLNYRNMIHMPVLILGGGSNLLFTKDFDGLVIRIKSKGIEVHESDQDYVRITVQAGEDWDPFVQFCVERRWAGLENLSLIPGTVGAAPIQNIGAYGVEVKETIESVHFVEIDSGIQKRFTNDECDFGYRESIFKKSLKGKIIILDVTFRLLKTSAIDISNQEHLKLDYGLIREELWMMNITRPGISDVREAVCAIRRRKLPDPAKVANAGSFFKNPFIPEEQKNVLCDRFPSMPWYPEQFDVKNVGLNSDNPVMFKIPAAWLIEQCGWKGHREGDAGVYPDQPLVLVNYGNAGCQQILDLMKRIIDSVSDRFGIILEPEVNIH